MFERLLRRVHQTCVQTCIEACPHAAKKAVVEAVENTWQQVRSTRRKKQSDQVVRTYKCFLNKVHKHIDGVQDAVAVCTPILLCVCRSSPTWTELCADVDAVAHPDVDQVVPRCGHGRTPPIATELCPDVDLAAHPNVD